MLDKSMCLYIIAALESGTSVAIIFPTPTQAQAAFFGHGRDSLEFAPVASKPGRLGVSQSNAECRLSFYFSVGRVTGYSLDPPERLSGLSADYTIDLGTPRYAYDY